MLSNSLISLLKTILGRSPCVTVSREMEGDTIVIIVGPTGTGKSTFINAVVGKEVAPVGHSLSTCTDRIEAYEWDIFTRSVPSAKEKVILVDTPGFNDTSVHDRNPILKYLAVFLGRTQATSYDVTVKELCQSSSKVGLIYLQDISQNRVKSQQRLEFQHIQELCKVTNMFSKLVLATYQWPENKKSQSYDQAECRTKSLATTFWKDSILQGARLARVEDSVQDPRNIVLDLLQSLA